MEKGFEDYFSELQADMVSICLEYVEKRAEKIYIYCFFEGNVLTENFFFKINGKIVRKHKVNDALMDGEKEYDISIARQDAVLNIIEEDIRKIRTLCQEWQREMPTEIRLVYDVSENKVNADYSYELKYSNDKQKTADDIFQEWFEEEKNKG